MSSNKKILPRYIIRKEFFGGLVWDREYKSYIGIADSFFNILQKVKQGKKVDKVSKKLLQKYEFITPKGINFLIIKEKNKHNDFVDFPLRVHLAVTQKCNMKCAHCFFQSNVVQSLPSNTFKDELRISHFSKLFEEMAANGCYELFIGGGEPFARKDIIEILKKADEAGVEMIKIFTNGTLLTEEIIEKLNEIKNLFYLSVSMESPEEEEYTKIRGPFYTQVLDKLRLLKKKAKFRVFIRWSVGKNLLSKYKEIVDFCLKVGIPNIKIRPIMPVGNALLNKWLIPSYEEYLKFLCNILEYGKKRKVNIEGSFMLHYGPTLRFSKKIIGFSKFVPLYIGFGGQGGYTSVYIDHRGFVSFCAMAINLFPPGPHDNIREKSLSELWDTAISLQEKRKLRGNKKCLECEYFPTCRGGCGVRAYVEFGDFNKPDPWCLKDLEKRNKNLVAKVRELMG
jgi:radical SAM protein with 4Fe4S-binding SPASM domain